MILSSLQPIIHQAYQQGIRRLLVLSGQPDWCDSQLHILTCNIKGDWLWLGEHPPSALKLRHCPAHNSKTLAGQEIHHAIFDARTGLNASALAILAGTLAAGSLLILLTPNWKSWPQHPDQDSRRWNDGRPPHATPNFIRHLQHCLQQSGETLYYHQHQPPHIPPPRPRPPWHPPDGTPRAEQRAILQQLLQWQAGTILLTAARGRGKSALAGMLIARWPGRVLVSAPARQSCHIIARHAAGRFHFLSPDSLLAAPPAPPDWLIIDEAASIPLPQLHRLITLAPRTLLTGTIQGYEGTGRGLSLKFCAAVPALHHLSLTAPIRWAAHDPLERLIQQTLLLDDRLPPAPQGHIHIHPVTQHHWQSQPRQMTQLYHLLTAAHYRTTPLDLRRIMDAPGQHFLIARARQKIAAALWLIDEGNLPQATSRAIWTGTCRPPGNLVAQSLAAHGIDPNAACLRGLRISRIAVHPARQRQGIGTQLIQSLTRHFQGYDYLSVSFGYTPALNQFWQHCGFRLMRLGSQREASSGCYTAIALLPLTPAARQLAHHQHRQHQRDEPWLTRFRQQLTDPQNHPTLNTQNGQLPIPQNQPASNTLNGQPPIPQNHPILNTQNGQPPIPQNHPILNTQNEQPPIPQNHPTPNPQSEQPPNYQNDHSLDDQDWLTLAGFAFAHRPLETSLGSLHRLLLTSPLPLPLLRARLSGTHPRHLCQQARLSGQKALLTHLRHQTASALHHQNPQRCQTLRQQILSWTNKPHPPA